MNEATVKSKYNCLLGYNAYGLVEVYPTFQQPEDACCILRVEK
jgi:hypothetical protein